MDRYAIADLVRLIATNWGEDRLREYEPTYPEQSSLSANMGAAIANLAWYARHTGWGEDALDDLIAEAAGDDDEEEEDAPEPEPEGEDGPPLEPVTRLSASQGDPEAFQETNADALRAMGDDPEQLLAARGRHRAAAPGVPQASLRAPWQAEQEALLKALADSGDEQEVMRQAMQFGAPMQKHLDAMRRGHPVNYHHRNAIWKALGGKPAEFGGEG
jgi:hypothetical protein